jgi:predicted lipoprotein with Yx(FWY)xxD motif
VRKGTHALALAVIAAVSALLLAACGGSGNGYGGGGGGGETTGASQESTGRTYGYTPANGEAEASGNAYVSLASSPGLGLILVDSKGFVLYAFDKDQGTTSGCYDECAKAWPPLLTEGPPQPSNGAAPGRLGTTERKDGATQVTYAGHPLYTYVADKNPGEAKGNGVSAFGGTWHALKGNGEETGG